MGPASGPPMDEMVLICRSSGIHGGRTGIEVRPVRAARRRCHSSRCCPLPLILLKMLTGVVAIPAVVLKAIVPLLTIGGAAASDAPKPWPLSGRCRICITNL